MALKHSRTDVTYKLEETGEFVINNYNYSKPLANFFPGIAGKYGIPMWVFYVNRGQGINSFGIDGKDNAILEFQPANKAWQQTSILGFRTFIKLTGGKKPELYEPFNASFVNQPYSVENSMTMSSFDMKIRERNKTLGLEVCVDYFTIPQENFAALVRAVTVTNTGRKPCAMQILDGLPRIVPFGIQNYFLKEMSRTIEAWIRVENVSAGAPLFKLNVDPGDRPEVVHITSGNFFTAFEYSGKKARMLDTIVDPETVFGPINDFSCPREFVSAPKFVYPKKQQTMCKLPSAFAMLDLKLAPGKARTFYEVIGFVRDSGSLREVVNKVTAPGYLEAKAAENRGIIETLQKTVETKSGSWEFDYYCKQTYLDNVMRGGYPVVFPARNGSTVYYLYSRKHGDLERDYNRFSLQPAYFSQGNGNYRDVNQNRRCDIWFNPAVGDFNIGAFMSLIQTDGYNPLVVKGASFALTDIDGFRAAVRGRIDDADIDKIIAATGSKFTPGDAALFIEEKKIAMKMSIDECITLLLSFSAMNAEAEHGEGFWIDHWHYNLDLIDSYLSVFPENAKNIVFDKKELTFFDNDAVVQPRRAKYVLYNGVPKQLKSVIHDEAKKKMFAARTALPHAVRSDYGMGDVYKTTVIDKLMCLFVNKMASLDPFGVGVQMEADKPNWFDALNGLPALFGSSACETFELKRLALMIRSLTASCGVSTVALTEEIAEFLVKLGALITEYNSSTHADKDFVYWDRSSSLKEEYRQKTKMGVSGRQAGIPAAELIALMDGAVKKLDTGLEKAKDGEIYYGYFIHEVVEYTMEGSTVNPSRFVQKRVVPFLEGQMHALRLAQDKRKARAIYEATKKSVLFDTKLKMYKVTGSLARMPEEIGRCRAFAPGWLENESIWMHMEYKYLLELLKQGLYEEFYADFRNVLIPFQKPERYGRSILENSSFLVSSAFPYPEMHGNGFVARLSGSTVEFLQIWLCMNIGTRPFTLDQKGDLTFRIAPLLAGSLFDAKNKTYSFRLFDTTQVVYHNPSRKNTFGDAGAVVRKIVFADQDGNQVSIESDTLPAPYAAQVRNCRISRIDVYLV